MGDAMDGSRCIIIYIHCDPSYPFFPFLESILPYDVVQVEKVEIKWLGGKAQSIEYNVDGDQGWFHPDNVRPNIACP